MVVRSPPTPLILLVGWLLFLLFYTPLGDFVGRLPSMPFSEWVKGFWIFIGAAFPLVYIWGTWETGKSIYLRFSNPDQSNGKGYLMIFVWVVVTFLAYILKIPLWLR